MSTAAAPFLPELYVNYFVSTVAGGAAGLGQPLLPTDQTLYLPTGMGASLPAVGPGKGTARLVLGTPPGQYEVVLLTAVSGDVATITRQQEGTSAVMWPVDTPISNDITALGVANLWTASTLVANVRGYGALGDGVLDRNASITSGTATLSTTSSPGPYSAAMVGRSIIVRGAGASGLDLWTTIASFTDSQHVTLSATAGTTVSGVYAFTVNTDDWPKLQSAFNAILAAGGGTLYLPPGVFYANYLNSNLGLAASAGVPVRIVGAGRDLTYIVSNGSALTAGTAFATTVSGGYLTVEDITLVAPAAPSGTFYLRGLWHQGGVGRLVVRRCAILGFATDIEADAATATNTLECVVDNCELTMHPTLALGTGCVAIGSAVRYSASFSNIHDFGVAASNQNHGMYVHPSADMDVTHCRFWTQRGTGWCVHNFNGSGTSPATSVTSCEFASDTYQAILTNPSMRAHYANNRYLSTFVAITIQNDCDIIGGSFDNCGASGNYIKQSSVVTAATNVRIRDAYFNPASATNCIWNNNTNAANLWKVSNCTFNQAETSAVLSSSPSNTYLFDCEYVNEGPGHRGAIGGSAPTLSAVNANVSSQAVAAGSNDVRGTISFNATATIGTASALFTVTFATPYGAAPIVTLTNAKGALTGMLYGVDNVTTTGFTIYTGQSMAALNNYKVNYRVEE